jgi:hypothetical protein
MLNLLLDLITRTILGDVIGSLKMLNLLIGNRTVCSLVCDWNCDYHKEKFVSVLKIDYNDIRP